METLQTGTVAAIYIAPSAGAPAEGLSRARVVAGRGVEGDRYFKGGGTFFEQHKPGQDLTLIEAEALEALAAEHGIALGPGGSRRNVVTRGVDLNALVGRRFRVGDIECVGDRLCDPCSHLQKVTQPGVLKGLVERGGLRADVLADGQIAVGDTLEELGAA
jgi:hypothetical protein